MLPEKGSSFAKPLRCSLQRSVHGIFNGLRVETLSTDMKISETPHPQLSSQVQAAFAVCGQVIQETWGSSHGEGLGALTLRTEATRIFRMLQRTYEESDTAVRACVQAKDLSIRLRSLRRELEALEIPFPKSYSVSLSEEQRADVLLHVERAIQGGYSTTIFLAADGMVDPTRNSFRPSGVTIVARPHYLHRRDAHDEWLLNVGEIWRPAENPHPLIDTCIGMEEGQFLHYHEHEDWSTLTCELFLAPRLRAGSEMRDCLGDLLAAVATTQAPAGTETVADRVLRWHRTLEASKGSMNVTTAASFDY